MTNKEAIEIVKTFRQAMDTPITEYRDILLGALDMAIKALEERPQGEWIITDAYPHKVYCSVCYKTFADSKWEVWKDGSLPRAYCPNCGADMRGDKND